MSYKITAKKEFQISERMTYQKVDKEVHCGFIWKSGSFFIDKDPSFLKDYDEQIGISLSDQDYSEVDLSEDKKKIIFFSETIPNDEQEMMSSVFWESQSTDDFDIAFQHEGWQLVEADTVMWGEIEVTEVEH